MTVGTPGLQAILKQEGNQAIAAVVEKFQKGAIQTFLLKQHAAAERNLKDAVRLAQNALGKDHIYVGLTQYMLGVTQIAQKHWADAEVTLRECIRIARTSDLLAHPRVTAAVSIFTQVLRQRGKHAEATALYQEVLQAQRDKFGPDTLLRGRTLLDFADHLDEVRAPAEQRVALQEAVSIFRKLPDGRRDLSDGLNQLGVAYFRDRQYRAAETCFQEAITVERELKTTVADRLKVRLTNLIEARLEQSQFSAELQPYFEEAERLCEQSPADQRSTQQFELRLQNSRWQRGRGQHVEAAAQARLAGQLAGNDPQRLYRVAAALAQCVPLAASSPAQSEEYAQEAITLLRQAVDHGFKDRKVLETDRDLAPLSGRSEFQQLLNAGKQKPTPSVP
jgi:tetratricopeptide (TPR) repeat protein